MLSAKPENTMNGQREERKQTLPEKLKAKLCQGFFEDLHGFLDDIELNCPQDSATLEQSL